MISLRPYQEKQKSQALSLVAEGVRRILLQSPTGSGKTKTGVSTALELSEGGRVLWVAARDELLDQGRDDLQAETGLRVAMVRPDEPPVGDARLVVASIQTLWKRKLVIPGVRVLVPDEARHYVADEWGPVVQAHGQGIVLGLDATPAHSDGRPLSDLFDRLIMGPQVQELIDAGWLMPSRHIAPNEPQRELSMRPAEAYLKYTPGTSAILYVDSLAEADRTAEELRAAGVAAESISGRTSKRGGEQSERKKILRRFRSGETAVLVNVAVLTEGVDLPLVETVGIFCGVDSLPSWLQRLGRGSRKAAGKRYFNVLDPCGHCWRPEIGFYETPWQWGLDGVRAMRRADDSVPEPVQCRGRREDGTLCLAWVRPPRCRICGSEVRGRERKRMKVRRAPMGEVAKAAHAQRDAEALARGEGGLIEKWIARDRAELLGLEGKDRNKAIARLVYRASGATRVPAEALFKRAWKAFKGEVRCV